MYFYTIKTFWKAILMLISAAIFSTTAMAADTPESFQIVDGMAIYLGVMPAEMIQGHPKEHQEHKMHGGIPAKGHRDHMVVALFDNKTGQRIENAKVNANVMELGLKNQQKELESMKIAGTITYGNYFDIPDKSTYHIKVEILRPGKPVVVAKFTHRHFDK